MSNRRSERTDSFSCHEVSRRGFLSMAMRLGAAGVVAPSLLVATASPVFAVPIQDNWRRCNKCSALFFNGYPKKGRCPAGGGHAATGDNFVLPHDIAQTRTSQGAWRFCTKCYAMFFDGYPQKGACPGGGGHTAAGYVFVLPHDIPVRGLAHGNWRFCNKCHTMFFDGSGTKGRCPAGNGHEAQGFNLVLRFRGNQEGDVNLVPAEG